MTTTNEITSEQIEKTLAWIKASHAAAETMDVQHMITDFFYPDAAVSFNDEPPAEGHQAMIDYFQRFYKPLSSMKHIIERVDVLPDRIYIEVQVEFVVKNDPEEKIITLHGLVAADKNIDQDMVSFYRIYTDKAPLLQRIQMFH